MDKPSEKQPLLSSASAEPLQGCRTHSSHHTRSNQSHRYPLRSRQSRLRQIIRLLLLIMVAISPYLVVASAFPPIRLPLPNNAVLSEPNPTNPLAISEQNIISNSKNPFGSISGPLITANFPDPAIIHVDGVSYAFATNNRASGPALRHVQIATSTDNQTWILSDRDALPEIGTWETGNKVWAPDVVRLDDGTFVLYYTDSLVSSPLHHCVGYAISQDIMGPYTPSQIPFTCPDINIMGGAIDPDGFYDESTGKRYVTYKIDGNSLGHGGNCNNGIPPLMATPIMLQEVNAADGFSKIGDPVQILDRDHTDGPLVEAPSLHRSDEGIYFLFYSSNCFTTPLYSVSYATATNVTGPYIRSGRPLIVTGDAKLVGPGGLDIVKGGDMVVFHAHVTDLTPDLKYRSTVENSEQEHVMTTPPWLVRGMWSARTTLKGHTVSLAKP